MLHNLAQIADTKQLLEKTFEISRIIKVEVGGYQLKPTAEADN